MDVDDFLKDFVGAVALNTAFEAGFIDRLLAKGNVAVADFDVNPAGSAMLLAMLKDAGVCLSDEGGYRLSPDFLKVLTGQRVLLEQKLAFVLLSAQDLLNGFPDLLFDLPKFMEKSKTFGLFRYDKAWQVTPDNLAHTRQWVDYVAALTKSESKAIIPKLKFGESRTILEIGGNIGAFALPILDAYPEMKITVFDLPAVCALGEEHVKDNTVTGRLNFFAGDARTDPWPAIDGKAPEVIMFKSVLHDWPETDVIHLLNLSAKALAPKGKVMICERGPMLGELGKSDKSLPFHMSANLVFAPFYRASDFYEQELTKLGFENITVDQIQAEMTFNIITANLKSFQ